MFWTPTTRYALAVALLIGSAAVRGQDDLPPETKALISKLKDEAKNKTPATRASAYKSMGELGSSGYTLRRTLVQGMLDPAVPARTAAADALKKIDEPLYKDATAIYIDKDMDRVARVADQRSRAEPLVPLILPMLQFLNPLASQPEDRRSPYKSAAYASVRDHLADCLRTLAAIGPDDELVNKGVLLTLVNPQAENRAVAVDLVAGLKNRKLGLQPLMALANSPREPDATRVKAVRLLPQVSDENTRVVARKVTEGLRFDSSPTVREAAEAALRRFGE